MSTGKNIPRKIELLAPARDAITAIEAIKHGADAVYMGASSHGARAAAGNSVEDIAKVVEFAHQFNAKVYITINTIVYNDEIEKVPELKIIAESDDSGVYMVMARGGREFFITGHSEYSPGTLDFEYHRDLEKGINPAIPANYYLNDDPSQQPIVRWRSHANLLFSNWLNYFVYQETPYDIREIK